MHIYAPGTFLGFLLHCVNSVAIFSTSSFTPPLTHTDTPLVLFDWSDKSCSRKDLGENLLD